jgi:lipase chaperone LimK
MILFKNRFFLIFGLTVAALLAYFLSENPLQNQLNNVPLATKKNSSIDSTLPDADRDDGETNQQLAFKSKYGQLVDSLRGIYFDRDLAIDEAGNIRVSSDIKDIFDFFFSAIEEEDLKVVLGRINEFIDFKLEEPARTQAKAILDEYVAYKSDLLDLEVAFSEKIGAFTDPEAGKQFSADYLNLVAERMDAVEELRAQHLSSDVHEAFYQEREQYDHYMLEKLQINTDSALTQEQKEQAQMQLDAGMPEEFISSRRDANPVQEVRSALDRIDTIDADQRYQARAEIVGKPAAARLSELDQARSEWNMRYQSYSLQRDAVLANDGLSAETQQAELIHMRERLFNETERVRVSALDRSSPR